MPHIEVVPNSTSISAPGWAYVPDNGYDPSKIAIQPTGARKRAARSSGLAGGDTTTRQQNAILKHLAELDKDNHRDVQILIPNKQKDNANKVSKNKVTQNVRRILSSQKTFANHLADEEAALASHDQNTLALGTPRASSSRPAKIASSHKRLSTATSPSTPNTANPSVTSIVDGAIAQGFSEDDPLLKSYVPTAPSQAIMEALLSGPALSYNGARAAPSVGKPQRRFCEICGYWGTIKCLKCGARNFRNQILPLTYQLERDGTASFHFTQGYLDSTPPPGDSDFWGQPPYLRFYETVDFQEKLARGFSREIRPESYSEEDKVRDILHTEDYPSPASIVAAIKYIHRLIAEEGPFEGIMGLSEGANVAATFLAADIRRCELEMTKSTFKAAVFFCGTPPFSSDGKRALLSDEDGEVLRLHTYHVIGSRDPMVCTSMALYNLCESDKATLFDHGQGHQITWDPKATIKIIKDIREIIHESLSDG